MFGIEEELISAKTKVFRVFSLIKTLGKEGSNVSSPTPIQINWLVPANLLAHTRLEAELKKEEALVYWDKVIRRRTF